MVNRSVLIFALAMGSAITALTQQAAAQKPEPPAARAQVLVLGVYHMSNPGHDVFNMKADDVLALPIPTALAPRARALKMSVPRRMPPSTVASRWRP